MGYSEGQMQAHTIAQKASNEAERLSLVATYHARAEAQRQADLISLQAEADRLLALSQEAWTDTGERKYVDGAYQGITWESGSSHTRATYDPNLTSALVSSHYRKRALRILELISHIEAELA